MVDWAGSRRPVPFESATALVIGAMRDYANEQIRSTQMTGPGGPGPGGAPAAPAAATIGRLALVVPAYLNERQGAALRDAAIIAGFESVTLIPGPVALLQAYADRHRTDLAAEASAPPPPAASGGAAQAAAAVGGGGGGGLVALVDVGHLGASVVVAVVGGGRPAQVVSARAAAGLGGAAIDAALCGHFARELVAGGTIEAVALATPRSRWLLRRAAERLKKTLSTLETAQV